MFAGKTVSLYKDDKKGETSTCDVESKRKRKSATGNPSTGRCCIGEQLDDISFGCEFDKYPYPELTFLFVIYLWLGGNSIYCAINNCCV